MQPYEWLGLPSPEECVGVAGLTISLGVLTLGIVIHVAVAASIWTWGLIVLGLFIGWVSFLYCVVWGQGRPVRTEG